MRDFETGDEQTIVTTLTHPFFVQLPQSRGVLQNAVMGGALPPSSEGHTYRGPLRDGYWVDAADLTAGYRLLNADATWAEVVTVEVVAEALQAYNLTVEGWHTYFVAANENAAPVWVHNGPCLKFGNLSSHYTKHGAELGVNSADEYLQQAINHLKTGTKFSFRHEGSQKVAYVTRLGDDKFMLTSVASGKRILTHLAVPNLHQNPKVLM